MRLELLVHPRQRCGASLAEVDARMDELNDVIVRLFDVASRLSDGLRHVEPGAVRRPELVPARAPGHQRGEDTLGFALEGLVLKGGVDLR